MDIRSLINLVIPIVLLVSNASVVADNKKGATKTDRLHQHIIKKNKKLKNRNELITVILESDKIDDASRQIIKSHSGQIRFKSGNKREIKIPASKLNVLLENLPESFHARLPYPHQALAVVSQGVDIIGASDMHSIGNGGEGVKVGIIDLGFSNYTNAQASGDLPAVLSIVDYTGTGTGGGNHGTNVAEIVHDMAPGAELYLAKVGTSLQLEQAVNDMLSAGVKIINHSVAWFGAAFYDGTGPICDITDNAETTGMQWINAMGNSRNAHYLGVFSDMDGDLVHEFASGQNSNTFNLTSGNTYSLVLNWDAYPTTNINYNLYLYNGDPDAGGSLVASSTTNQRGSGSSYPYEAITYTATATALHHIVITKNRSSTANVPLSLFSTGAWGSLGVRTNTSSIVQPADCHSVIGVGATSLTDGVEGGSSEGPTTDGRNKPEISATNRTQTSLSSSFTGTSAASPHVAGAAALLLSQHPEFSTSDLRARLIADSQDVSTIGFDYRTGYGRVSMDADEDGFNHDTDNCVLLSNINQLDTDTDSQGNVCDADDDNDGLTDALEISIGTDSLLIDTDTDGLSDYFEVGFDGDFSLYTLGSDLDPLSVDTDGDTISDYDEISLDGDSMNYVVGVDLDPLSVDTDGDTFQDNLDPIPLDFNYADGDVVPLGAPDGIVNIADYVVLQQIYNGLIEPSISELSHADVYPVDMPDGVIGLSDLMIIQKNILQ